MSGCNGIKVTVCCAGGSSGTSVIPYGDWLFFKGPGNTDLLNPQNGDWRIIVTAGGNFARENYSSALAAWQLVSQDDKVV